MDANNDVENGIRYTSMKLSDGGIKVCRKCTSLIGEFQSYVWDDKASKRGLDRPKKENDHALDALRYALYTHFAPMEGGTTNSRELEERWREATGQGQQLPPMFQNPNDSPYRF